MTHQFSETDHGFPRIDVNPPYELVGEILRGIISSSSTSELLVLIDEVISGRKETATHYQEGAEVSFDRTSNNAHIWIDGMRIGIYENIECDITLGDFREITADWLDYLKKREDLRKKRGQPLFGD